MSETNERKDAVLVTGGSGFVGQNLVSKLAEKSKPVVSMYHHKLPEPRDNVFPVCSDMGSAELLAAPLRGVKTVVHLAWEGGFTSETDGINWQPDQTDQLPKNVKIFRNLIKAVEKSDVQRVIFLSAIGASRKTRIPFLMEKYLCEFYLLNSNIREKVVLRSSVAWSGKVKEDKFLEAILGVMKYRLYPVPVKEEGISPIYLDDLTKMITKLCHAPLTQDSSLLEVHGGKTYTTDEFFRLFAGKVYSGRQIGLRGALGRSYLSLLEKYANKTQNMRLEDFLAVGTSLSKETQIENPLLNMVSKKMREFELPSAENLSEAT